MPSYLYDSLSVIFELVTKSIFSDQSCDMVVSTFNEDLESF